jgi:hypothetical protein
VSITCSFKLIIFQTVLLRAVTMSSFKKNIMKGGESKKDLFGSPIDKNTVYLHDLQSGTSTR